MLVARWQAQEHAHLKVRNSQGLAKRQRLQLGSRGQRSALGGDLKQEGGISGVQVEQRVAEMAPDSGRLGPCYHGAPHPERLPSPEPRKEEQVRNLLVQEVSAERHRGLCLDILCSTRGSGKAAAVTLNSNIKRNTGSRESTSLRNTASCMMQGTQEVGCVPRAAATQSM